MFPFAALTGQDTDFYSLLVEPQLTWAPNLDHTVVFGASYTREHGAFGDSTIADRSNLLGSDATLARIAAGIQAGMAAGGVPNPTVTLVRDPAIGAVFPLSRGQREQFDIFSAYVQDEWALADGLRLVPGLRYDHHSVFGSVGSPKVSLLYALAPTTRVRTSAGRAFRAPSLFELFGNVVFHGPIPGLPNPDLEPEHITSFDAGIQHEVSRAFRAEMNVFHNDMTDLIQLTISPQRDHFDWVNVAEARSTGLELVANGDATSWLGYYANYSYTDSEDRATGNALALVPRHKVNAGLQLGAEVGSWGLTGSIDQRWVGTRTQSSQGIPVLLDEYARTDLALYLRPNNDLRVGVHVLNVMDADYQETAASPDARPSRLGEPDRDAVLGDRMTARTEPTSVGPVRTRRAGLWSHRKRIVAALLGAAVLWSGLAAYQRHLAVTRVAFVNFPGFQLARIERARRSGAVRVEALDMAALDRAADYPVRLRVRARPAARRDAARAPARRRPPRRAPLRAGRHEPGPGRHQPARPGARRGQRLPRVRRRRELRPAAQLLARGARRQVVPLGAGAAAGRALHGRAVPPGRRLDVRDRRRVRRLLRRAGARQGGRAEDRSAHERARPVQRQPRSRRCVHPRARRPRVERLPGGGRREAPGLPATDCAGPRGADAARAAHPGAAPTRPSPGCGSATSPC